MRTLVDLLDRARRAHGTEPAVSIHLGLRDRTWTYEELWRAANGVARHLRDVEGLRPGTPVAVWAANSPRLVAAYFGALLARLILVPIDPFSTAKFATRVIERTGAPVVIGDERAAGDLPARMIPLGDLPCDTGSVPPAPVDLPAADDVAEVVFTSGTTGAPKGVILTHANVVANVEAVTGLVPNRAFNVLSLLPLSHMFEQTVGLYVPLLVGASIHYATSHQPGALLKAMRRQRTTAMLVVPRVLDLMLRGVEREVERLGRRDQWERVHLLAAHLPMGMRRSLFHSVHRRFGGDFRFVLCGGARLPAGVGDAWERMGVRVIEGYGATECAPIVAANTFTDRVTGTVGRPVPGVETRIDDDGQLLVRGPNVTPGYWEDAEATAAAFDEHGWYRTGDVVSRDDTGRLRLEGRLRDLIVLASGMNVYPEDVEAELRTEREIADCVVGSLPDAAGNSTVHAALIPGGDDGAEVDREALAAAVHRAGRRLAPHQRVTGFTIWTEEDFPRTTMLKAKRHEVFAALPAQAADRAVVPARPPGPDRNERLHEVLAGVTDVPGASIGPTADLTDDLELDSLALVELAGVLEDEFGTVLEDGDLAEARTVADLAALLEGGAGSAQQPVFPRWALRPAACGARRLVQRLVVFPGHALVARPFTEERRAPLGAAGVPALLVASHCSHLDTPSVLRALPAPLRRRVAVAAAADYFYRRRSVGVAVTLALNTFPFSRAGGVRSSLEYCGELMDRGWSILIYPEGTRSTTGALGPFQRGIGLLAIELGAPVVPIHVTGTHAALPKGRSRPRRGPIAVRFGAPITLPPTAEVDEVTARLEGAVASLAPHPPAVPPALRR